MHSIVRIRIFIYFLEHVSFATFVFVKTVFRIFFTWFFHCHWFFFFFFIFFLFIFLYIAWTLVVCANFIVLFMNSKFITFCTLEMISELIICFPIFTFVLCDFRVIRIKFRSVIIVWRFQAWFFFRWRFFITWFLQYIIDVLFLLVQSEILLQLIHLFCKTTNVFDVVGRCNMLMIIFFRTHMFPKCVDNLVNLFNFFFLFV